MMRVCCEVAASLKYNPCPMTLPHRATAQCQFTQVGSLRVQALSHPASISLLAHLHHSNFCTLKFPLPHSASDQEAFLCPAHRRRLPKSTSQTFGPSPLVSPAELRIPVCQDGRHRWFPHFSPSLLRFSTFTPDRQLPSANQRRGALALTACCLLAGEAIQRWNLSRRSLSYLRPTALPQGPSPLLFSHGVIHE